MRNTNIDSVIALCCLAIGAFVLLPATAVAAGSVGAVIDPSALAVEDRAQLERRVDAAKTDRPDAFDALREIKAALPEFEARMRGSAVVVSPALKSLGPGALLPMLEELALDGSRPAQLTDNAWLGWQVGLLEAVGMLRDTSATPVLVAILDCRVSEPILLSAAARALARIGTDRAAAELVARSKVAGPGGEAVLASMGHCRRLVVVQRLAAAMAEGSDPRLADAVARSLGDVGSSWAWQTEVIANGDDGDKIRAAAATALVDAFTRADPDLRRTIIKAILVVDHPSTSQLIVRAGKHAEPALQEALATLETRFDANPIR